MANLPFALQEMPFYFGECFRRFRPDGQRLIPRWAL